MNVWDICEYVLRVRGVCMYSGYGVCVVWCLGCVCSHSAIVCL